MAEGYRVVTITYRYYFHKEDAIKWASKGRNKGARTKIITEDEYRSNPRYHIPMQDLTQI